MLECNQKELAKILGLTDRRIRQLAEEGMFARDPKTRKYNIPKCVQEYIRFKIESETGESKTADYESVRSDHEEIKKEISMLKLRRIRGELHDAKDVEAVIGDMLIRFRGKLLAVPAKLAPQLLGQTDPNQVVSILKTEMHEVLLELSEYNPKDFIDDRIDDDESENDELD